VNGFEVEALPIDGAWALTPQQFPDARGTFLEWFRQDTLAAAIGHPLNLLQANASVSAAGVIRGIHFADVPPSQAKYVTCVYGAVLDVVVDIRIGSPTFGRWASVLLDDADRRAVYVGEGLGHAFMSLAPGSTVVYLCSATYAPDREHTVNALDDRLGINWPVVGRDGTQLEPVLSDKDGAAPSLNDAAAARLLPTYEQATKVYARLRSMHPA